MTWFPVVRRLARAGGATDRCGSLIRGGGLSRPGGTTLQTKVGSSTRLVAYSAPLWRRLSPARVESILLVTGSNRTEVALPENPANITDISVTRTHSGACTASHDRAGLKDVRPDAFRAHRGPVNHSIASLTRAPREDTSGPMAQKTVILGSRFRLGGAATVSAPPAPTGR